MSDNPPRGRGRARGRARQDPTNPVPQQVGGASGQEPRPPGQGWARPPGSAPPGFATPGSAPPGPAPQGSQGQRPPGFGPPGSPGQRPPGFGPQGSQGFPTLGQTTRPPPGYGSNGVRPAQARNGGPQPRFPWGGNPNGNPNGNGRPQGGGAPPGFDSSQRPSPAVTPNSNVRREENGNGHRGEPPSSAAGARGAEAAPRGDEAVPSGTEAASRGAHRGAAHSQGDRKPTGKLAEALERLSLFAGKDAQRPMSIGKSIDQLKECASFATIKMVDERKTVTDSEARESSKSLSEVYTNAYRVTSSAGDFTLYSYVVEFSPNQDSTRQRRQLVRDFVAPQFPFPISFDGMNGWSRHQTPQEETTIVGNFEGQRVSMLVRRRAMLPINSPTTKQMLNVLLRQAQSRLGQTQIGRNFYLLDLRSEVNFRQYRLHVAPGCSTRIDNYTGGLLCVLDYESKVLRQETVLDYIRELVQRMGRDEAYRRIRLELVGMSVLCRYNNKTYKIDDFDFDKNPGNKFDKDGEPITYIEYYKQRYNINVHPQQPLIVHRLKGSEKREAERRGRKPQLDLMPELSFLTGQSQQMREDYSLQNALMSTTRPEVNDRVAKYRQIVHGLENPKAKAELEPWGVRVDKELVRVENPRQLKAETIYIGCAEKPIDLSISPNPSYPRDVADWSRDMNSKSLFDPRLFGRWALVLPARDQQPLHNFVALMTRFARDMKLDLPEAVMETRLPSVKGNDYVQAVRALCRDPRNESISMVVVFLPSKNHEAYTACKNVLSCEFGIPSQMIVITPKIRQADRNLPSIARKIVIQMQAKLGGIPWTIKVPLKGTMVVGIDVYHDPKRKEKSVLGFVATMDNNWGRYWSTTREQNFLSDELLPSAESLMTEAWKRYKEINGALPNRTLVYRDGVGEGQLRIIKDQEVAPLERAWKDLTFEKLRLAYTVVTKRIPQRFFLKENGQFKNVSAGTVINDTVTKPEYQDFFVVSQSVNRGTVTPTHYNIIWNNADISVYRHQILAHKLTHMYYNWQGTIKVPAPTQYAHKLAYLVGEKMKGRRTHLKLEDKLHYL